MSKVNLLIKSCLINEKKEYNIKGIYQGSKIKYKELNNIIIIDLKLNTLNKVENNKNILLDFKKEICFITIDNLSTNFKIEVLKSFIDKKSFYVKYKINDNYYEYNLNII